MWRSTCLEKIDCYDSATRSQVADVLCACRPELTLATEAKRRKRRHDHPSTRFTKPWRATIAGWMKRSRSRHTPGRYFCEIRTGSGAAGDPRIRASPGRSPAATSSGEPAKSFLQKRPTFNETAEDLGVTRHTIYRRRQMIQECVAEDRTRQYPQGKKQVYRVTFRDGSSTECCDEHLWFTTTFNERKKHAGAVRTLKYIRQSLRYGMHFNHAVMRVLPVEFESKPQPIEPWLLGMWLGDGVRSKNSSEHFG